MKKAKTENIQIRADLFEILEKTFPDGQVDMPFDLEENYFYEIYDELMAEFRSIKGAVILYERDQSGDQYKSENSDFYEDEPGYSDLSSSYHLIFLGLTDNDFKYEVEGEMEINEYEDDEGLGDDFPEKEMIQDDPGVGTAGCAVGI